ncbi:hypothetical protein WDW89_06160 [Deltaproteobacteria bacterium TL4]
MVILAITLTMGEVSLNKMQERYVVANVAEKISLALKQAQMMSMTQFRSHQVIIESNQLKIIPKLSSADFILLWDQLPITLEYDATRWPSFSPFGFAASGTITITSSFLSTQIIVSPIGHIQQTAIETRKK